VAPKEERDGQKERERERERERENKKLGGTGRLRAKAYYTRGQKGLQYSRLSGPRRVR